MNLPAAEQTHWDEMLAGCEDPRPAWTPIYQHLQDRSFSELEQLARLAARTVAEHEVTYTIVDGERRPPWHLDSVPFVIGSDEWSGIEAGIRQRAQVLEAVLGDCYGHLRLTSEGIVPAALLSNLPGLLRPCRGWRPVGGHRLHLYAADLARGPDGRWQVVGDRCQAPSGLGYALENRLVIARCLGDLFADNHVRRFAAFFDAMKEGLEALAPAPEGQPRVAVLAGGASGAFEDAYLARYLGVELVESRDLVVRNGRLFLKTIGGLRGLDVLLRRLEAELCDPLHLRPDALGGVPGLLACARAGRVAIANSLGSSLAGSPALFPMIPAAARTLLGQDLLLPQPDSWWLGFEGGVERTLDRLDHVVLKPLYDGRRGDPLFPVRLPESDRLRLAERLRERPGDWMAEELIELSRAPVWNKGHLHSRPVGLRVFACRDRFGDWRVLPGGLARVASESDRLMLSLQRGGSCKDCWIVGDPEAAGAPLPAMPQIRLDLRRGGLDLPSRLLDDVHWLGRYIERADQAARLLRLAIERGAAETEPSQGLADLIRHLAEAGHIPKACADGSPAVLVAAITAPDAPEGLASLLERCTSLARTVRSRLSRDLWQLLAGLQRPLADGLDPRQRSAGSALLLLEQVIHRLAAVAGLAHETMVRSHVWSFLELGRRVEHGQAQVALLRALLPASASRPHLELVLEASDSRLTYRARYRSALLPAPTVDLVIADPSNPRALAYQAAELRRLLAGLPTPDAGIRRNAPERLAITLAARIEACDVEAACAGDGEGLRRFLDGCAADFLAIGDEIARTWFIHASDELRGVGQAAWAIDDEVIP